MKKLRKFEEEQSYWNGIFIYPTVVYAVDSDTVFFEKESYILSTYNVSSTTSPTVLLGTNFDMNQVSKMYIGEDEIEPTKQYTFNQTGTYTVKTVFKYLNSFYGLFESAKQLIDVNLNNIDTRKVRNTAYMFYSASNLTSLDLSMLNTSNVENMRYMFAFTSSLNYLNISNLDTSNVTDISYMFAYCNLLEININHFNTSKLKYMCGTFKETNITKIDLSNLNLQNVVSVNDLFNNCDKLTEFTFSENWSNNNIKSFRNMFTSCGIINKIDLSLLNTSNAINFNDMFYRCVELSQIIGIGDINVEKAKDLGFMFAYCGKLTNLDLSKWHTDNLVYAHSMFRGCNNLTTLSITNFNTSNVYCLTSLFDNCSSLETIDVSSFNTSKCIYFNYMFNGCKNLTNIIGIENFDTSNAINIQNMFYNCINLSYLDLSKWDVNNVVRFDAMFGECHKLNNLKLGEKFNGNSGKFTTSMFYKCSGLTSIDLSNFTLPNVESTDTMFAYCTNLTSLDLSNITSDIICYTRQMFLQCEKLNEIKMFKFINSTHNDEMLSGTFWFLSPSCNIIYNKAYDYSKLLDNSITKIPTSCTHSSLDSVVNIRVRIVSDSNEIKEGTVIVNNTNGIYNSEKDYWEFTYNASTYEYDILLNGEIIGKVNHSDKIQYIFIGENNWDYERFNIIEKINVTSTTEDYRFIGNGFNRVMSIFINGVEQQVKDAYNFNEIGEYEIRIIFDCENLKSIQYMFSIGDWYGNTYITNLTFTKDFDTSNVIDMESLFSKSRGLIELNIDYFNTNNVISIESMFESCEVLKNINLSNFNTHKLINMDYVFVSCYSLTKLDLSSLDTSNVRTMEFLMDYCKSLKELNLNNLNTDNVISFYAAFQNLFSLESLDMSSLNMENACNIVFLLYGNEKLSYIKFGTNLNGSTGTQEELSYLPTKGIIEYKCGTDISILTNVLPPTWEIKCVE